MAYPLVLKIRERNILVVGGGKVATRKVTRLLSEESNVTVVAPHTSLLLQQWSAEGRLRLHTRAYLPTDMVGMQLVFAATNKRSLNAQVAREAKESGIWVNVADSSAESDFTLPAVASFGDLQLAIDTGGAGPALSRQLRAYLADHLPDGWQQGTAIFRTLRPLVRPLQDEATRRRFWRTLVRDLPNAAAQSETERLKWIENAAQESGLLLDQKLIIQALDDAFLLQAEEQ